MTDTFTEKEKGIIFSVKEKIEDKMRSIPKLEWYDPRISWESAFLTGGAIASLIQGEEPKDWDIYFKDADSANDARRLIEKSMRSHIKKVDSKYASGLTDENGIQITANAITMNGGISFISTFAGSPEQIKKTFDFVHCTPHYDIQTNVLYISKNQYLAAINKKLIVNNPKNIVSWRLEKFKSRGYTE